MPRKKTTTAPTMDSAAPKAKRGRKPKSQAESVVAKTTVRKVGRPKGSVVAKPAVTKPALKKKVVKKDLAKKVIAKKTPVKNPAASKSTAASKTLANLLPKKRGRKPGSVTKASVTKGVIAKKITGVKKAVSTKKPVSSAALLKSAQTAAERLLAPLQANIVKAQAKLLAAQKKLLVQAEKNSAKLVKQYKAAVRQQKTIEKNLQAAQTRAKKLKTPMAQKKMATLQKALLNAQDAVKLADVNKTDSEMLVDITKSRLQLAKQSPITSGQSNKKTLSKAQLGEKASKPTRLLLKPARLLKKKEDKPQTDKIESMVKARPGRPPKSAPQKTSVKSTRISAKTAANGVVKADSATLRGVDSKAPSAWQPVVVPTHLLNEKSVLKSNAVKLTPKAPLPLEEVKPTSVHSASVNIETGSNQAQVPASSESQPPQSI